MKQFVQNGSGLFDIAGPTSQRQQSTWVCVVTTSQRRTMNPLSICNTFAENNKRKRMLKKDAVPTITSDNPQVCRPDAHGQSESKWCRTGSGAEGDKCREEDRCIAGGSSETRAPEGKLYTCTYYYYITFVDLNRSLFLALIFEGFDLIRARQGSVDVPVKLGASETIESGSLTY